jgi:cell division protein FtsW (lipid II flippase)
MSKRNKQVPQAPEATGKRRKAPDSSWLVFAIVVFEVSGMGLLALREGALDPIALALAVALPVLLALQMGVLSHFFPYMDRYLFIVAHFLCALGVIVLYRLGADKGLKHFLYYGAGCVAQIIALVVIARFKGLWRLRYVIMGGCLLLLLAAVVLGTETYGAKNWISIGGFSMQPSEFVKVAVPVVLALYLSRSKRLLDMLPAGVFLLGCVGLLVLQKDLGAVLIYFCAAIFMYFVSTSDWILTSLGIVCAAEADAWRAARDREKMLEAHS